MISSWSQLQQIILRGVVLKGITRIQPFSRSSVNQLKKIVQTEKDGNVTVEGVYIKSPREDYLIKPPVKNNSKETGGCSKEACPLCRLGPLVKEIKHTDVLILAQFVRPDGSVLPKRISGLCGPQQRRIRWLVDMAAGAGLMKNTEPNYSWKRYNKYYDCEDVIHNFFTHRKMRA